MEEKLKLALEAVAVKFSEKSLTTNEAHWKAVIESQSKQITIMSDLLKNIT